MIATLLGATLFLLGLILGNSDILTSGLIVAFIGVNLYILKLLLEFIIDTSERTKLSSSESETQELLCRA
jgi:hypothetical protein